MIRKVQYFYEQILQAAAIFDKKFEFFYFRFLSALVCLFLKILSTLYPLNI